MSPRRARKADFDGLDDAGRSVRSHQQRIVEPTTPELTGHKATEGGRRRKRLRHAQKKSEPIEKQSRLTLAALDREMAMSPGTASLLDKCSLPGTFS